MNQTRSTALWITIQLGVLLLVGFCTPIKAADVDAASLLVLEKQALRARDVQKKLEAWRDEQRAPDSDVVPAAPADLLKTNFGSLQDPSCHPQS